MQQVGDISGPHAFVPTRWRHLGGSERFRCFKNEIEHSAGAGVCRVVVADLGSAAESAGAKRLSAAQLCAGDRIVPMGAGRGSAT